MKRGYALKERSNGKKNELVKKKENEPHRRPRKCASPKCHYYPIFAKKFKLCNQ